MEIGGAYRPHAVAQPGPNHSSEPKTTKEQTQHRGQPQLWGSPVVRGDAAARRLVDGKVKGLPVRRIVAEIIGGRQRNLSDNLAAYTPSARSVHNSTALCSAGSCRLNFIGFISRTLAFERYLGTPEGLAERVCSMYLGNQRCVRRQFHVSRGVVGMWRATRVEQIAAVCGAHGWHMMTSPALVYSSPASRNSLHCWISGW